MQNENNVARLAHDWRRPIAANVVALILETAHGVLRQVGVGVEHFEIDILTPATRVLRKIKFEEDDFDSIADRRLHSKTHNQYLKNEKNFEINNLFNIIVKIYSKYY